MVPIRRVGVSAAVAIAVVAGTGILAGPARADDPPAQFAVAGSGYGHGVGMSQWGAYGMAKAGFDPVAIVTHYYSGTTVAPVQDDMDIRVSLLHEVPGVRFKSEPLDPTGGAVEVTVNGNVTVGSPADEFRLTPNGAAINVQRVMPGGPVDLGTAPSVTVRWAGTRTPGTAAGGPTVLNLAGINGSLSSAGHRYRYGYLEVMPVSTPSGVQLNAVNSLRLHDEYLYGISEVSSAWPMAAMQAQVLAARTYAISKVSRGVRTACSCHLDDGGGPYFDQTFTGYAKAAAAKGDQWVAAVNGTAASDTTGLAILYGGAPISAFYNASSGGITQSSKEVWGKDLPYAQAVADPYMQVPENSVRAWSVSVPQARMASAFGVPAVAKVAIAERFPSGAPKTIVATTPDGATVARGGAAIQSALALKSSYITTIDGNLGVPLPTVDPATTPGAPAPAAPAAPADPSAPPADPNAAPADGPTLDVQQRTVSLLTPTTITAGTKKYKVAGVVRPSKAGLKVWRQILVKKKWQTVEKTVTNAKGHYKFHVTAKTNPPGTYRVLVVKKHVVVGVSPQYTVAG